MTTDAQVARDRRPLPGWWPTAVGWTLLVLGFAISFGRSVAVGRAGAELTYDDVSYAVRGNEWATSLLDRGLWPTLLDYLHAPAHSPVTEAIATAAALIGGPSTFRIYLFNAVFIATLLVLLARVVLRSGWAAALGGAGFALALPYGYFAIDQFRPDPSYVIGLGIVTGLAGHLAIDRAADLRRQALALGLGAAALLYLKPTFFVFTAVTMTALAAWTLLVMRPPGGARDRVRYLLRSAGWFVLATVPFWAVFFRSIAQYVYDNKVGQNAAIWNNADAWYALRNSMMQSTDVGGWTVTAAIAAGLLAAVLALLRRRPRWLLRATAFLLVGVVAMGPVALARETHVFFGSVPVVLMLLAAVVAVVDVVLGWSVERRSARPPTTSRHPVRAGVAVAAGLVLLLIAVAYRGPTPMQSPDGLRAPMRVNSRVLAAIIDDCATRPACDAASLSHGVLPPTLVPFAAEVSWMAMDWEATLLGWDTTLGSFPLDSTAEGAVAAVDGFDYVVTLGPQPAYVNPALPMNQIQAELAAHLATSPDWQELSLPVISERFRLFARVAP